MDRCFVIYLCPLLIVDPTTGEDDIKEKSMRREYELIESPFDRGNVYLYRARGDINVIDCSNKSIFKAKDSSLNSSIPLTDDVGAYGYGYVANLWKISFNLRRV